eukprot:TRINITY_DN742_c0_g1_i2.p2 TRINITY_DN742_c0_g1~~TRINITY_DN742_c0_g1_i2.p2  ORF type:complete len:157 (+),score=26.79 TRINITY_DN742_c0_g1_i2:153-623(+)
MRCAPPRRREEEGGDGAPCSQDGMGRGEVALMQRKERWHSCRGRRGGTHAEEGEVALMQRKERWHSCRGRRGGTHAEDVLLAPPSASSRSTSRHESSPKQSLGVESTLDPPYFSSRLRASNSSSSFLVSFKNFTFLAVFGSSHGFTTCHTAPSAHG